MGVPGRPFQLPPPSTSASPHLAQPLLPDSGKAARVALKHIGIVEHGPSRVSPSRLHQSVLRLSLDPNSLGHSIAQHRQSEIGIGQVGQPMDPERHIKEPTVPGWINDSGDRYKETQTGYTGMLPSSALKGSHATCCFELTYWRRSGVQKRLPPAEMRGSGAFALSRNRVALPRASVAPQEHALGCSAHLSAPEEGGPQSSQWEPAGVAELLPGRRAVGGGRGDSPSFSSPHSPGRNEPIGRTCELPDHCEVS